MTFDELLRVRVGRKGSDLHKGITEMTMKKRALWALADIGVTPDMAVIVSCGHGQISAHTYFILKYVLGFPKVRNYDGGFNEWSNVDALPVESQ
jgi:3-mercaptopyruvate sulfurtransferase SseA